MLCSITVALVLSIATATRAPAADLQLYAASAAVAAKPFSIEEIEGPLEAGVSAKRVTEIVDERGVRFESDGAVRERLRAAGASDGLFVAVDRASTEFLRGQLRKEHARGDVNAPSPIPGVVAPPARAEPAAPAWMPSRTQLVRRSNVSGDVVTIDGRAV